ncbi:MAG: TFIIB-type zinc ribbon-containing protein [Clostridia bacterium]|nr:TFIIB-type zinc ribbon-containing protein [Clostridia bacterium]
MSVVEQKCPNCSSPTRFDPEKGKLVCDYCGAIIDIDTQEVKQGVPKSFDAEIEGFDFDSLSEQAVDLNAEDLPIYICESCGAEIVAAPEQFALTCPYCQNNVVLSDKASGNLRPDGLIPFKFTVKELPALMSEFYKNKTLLPKNFFSDSKMGKITGVYVPFWIFEGDLSGSLNFHATSVRKYRSGNYDITETAHYNLVRDVSVGFKDLPVDASNRIEDALMDSLEPFEFADTTPFNIDYLQGFTADRFDVAKGEIKDRAERRMQSTAKGCATSKATDGYTTANITGGSLKANIKAKYLLLPVYLFDIMHDGKAYSFAVNGQTGKVVGDLPIDKKRSFAYLLKTAGIVAGILLSLIVSGYFLGR